MKSIAAISFTASLAAILTCAPLCAAQGTTGPYVCDVGLVSGSAITAAPVQVQASITVSGANGCIGFIEISTWAQTGTNYVLDKAITTGYGVGTYSVTAPAPNCAYKVVLSNPPDGSSTQAPAGPALGIGGAGTGTCTGITSTVTLKQNTIAIPATGATSGLAGPLAVAAISYGVVLLRRVWVRESLAFSHSAGNMGP